jgi:hypothetical protein
VVESNGIVGVSSSFDLNDGLDGAADVSVAFGARILPVSKQVALAN